MKNIAILDDYRLFPSSFNIIEGTNKIDKAVYTMENYIVNEHDLSTYDWYAVFIGVNGIDEVKLTSKVDDGKLLITFDLNEYVTNIGNTLTYQIVAKDDISAVWYSAKGVIFNSESIHADEFIPANYASILRQWELRIEEMAGSLDSAIFYIPYGEDLPKEQRLDGRLYYKYLYAENLNGQLEDSDGNILIPEQVAKNIGLEPIEGLTGANVQTALESLKVMIENKDSLPAQTGNEGKFLKTDGTSASWEDVDALPDQTGNKDKVLMTDGSETYWSVGPRGLPLFGHIWSDHLFNDVSYLRADTFSWHSGGIYVAAYNEFLNEYNEGTEETEGNITFRRTASGYKIADASQEGAVRSLYETTGVAWYYLIDTENTQFKLPRTKWGFTGLRDKVGGYVEAGLPTHTHTRGSMNIKGSIPNVGVNQSETTSFSGALYTSASGNNYGGTSSGSAKSNILFDASRNWTGETSAPNNAIYGKSSTVQPPATQMYLYFYVGNYYRNIDEIDVGKWSELAHGVDIDAFSQEVDVVKQEALAEVQSAGQAISSYQQPLVVVTETSGTVALEVNKIYTMEITADTTFSLPTEVNTSFFNQIKVMAKIVGTPVITWGTTYFVNKEAPELEEGVYDLYFDYDNHLAGWVVGAISKGA